VIFLRILVIFEEKPVVVVAQANLRSTSIDSLYNLCSGMVLSSDAHTVDLLLPNEEKLTALKLRSKQDKNASELAGSVGLYSGIVKPAAHKARFVRFFPAASTLHTI